MDPLKALPNFREQLKKFVEFDDLEWSVFKNYLTFQSVKKKKHFAEPGKVCNDIAFIISGSVRYYYIKDGDEITSYFSFENELAGSYKTLPASRALSTSRRSKIPSSLPSVIPACSKCWRARS